MHTSTFSSRLSLLLMGLLSMLLLAGCGGANLFERLSSPLGGGLCGLIILILDIIIIMDVLKSSRETSSKVIWILVIVFLPVLGIILYWIFG